MKIRKIISLFLLLPFICTMLPTNISVAKADTAGKVIAVSSADDFCKALTGAADGDTIKLTANIDLGTVGGVINSNIAVILDLNGHTITYSGEHSAIWLNKDEDELINPSLTIEDTSSQTGSGITATGIGGSVVCNSGKGTLKVEGGTLTSEQYSVVFSNGGGDLTVSGGKLLTSKGNAISMFSGHLSIEGGEFAVTSDQYATIFF